MTIALVVLFFVLLFSFKQSAANTITTDVMIGDLEIQSSTYDDAEKELVNYYSKALSQPLNFTYKDITISLAPSELGFTFNSQKTISDIKTISATNSLIKHWGQRLTSLFITQKLPPIIEVDSAILNTKLEQYFPNIVVSKDAQVQVDTNGNISLQTHIDGKEPNLADLKSQITKALIYGNQDIQISTTETKAFYNTESAESDAEKLKSLLKHKHTLTYTETIENQYTYKFFIPPYAVKVKNGEFTVNENELKKHLEQDVSAAIEREATNLTIKALPKEGELYAQTEGHAVDGRHIDYKSTAEAFIKNIKNGLDTTEIVITTSPSKVINETGVDLGPLQKLSQGRSSFAKSGFGRKYNIRKGVSEKVHNILLKPDQEYSFNSTLGEINRANGWEQSLAIFGGQDLIPVPGGGLCQVSTTLYRALVGAGLEILEKSNHTLYILYYEEFGNGLDAAIYPGSKDLRFRNNTENYLFIQAYNDGDDAYVELYGQPIYKSVELIGPLYAGRVPENLKSIANPNWNEIAWIQKITENDGTVKDNLLMSKYITAPRKLYPYKED